MSNGRLTPVSGIVLGLVKRDGPCTPYDIKAAVERSVGAMWPFPHSQIYSEAARLAREGLLSEEIEEKGRRRKIYRITQSGSSALRRWLSEPDDHPAQVRSLGILKLFFGAFASTEDILRLAQLQEKAHKERLATARGIEARIQGREDLRFQLLVLRAGIRFDEAQARLWSDLKDGSR